MSTFGLAYLLFLAGLEIDVSRLRTGRPLRSGLGWVFSITVALLVSDVLQASNLLHHSVTVALCLSTTALGTLVPILRDGHVFETRLGTVTLTVGSIGEFGPIVIAALLLSTTSVVATGALTVGFIVLVVATATLAGRVRPPQALRFLRRHLHSTSQLPVRLSVLVIVALEYLALTSGLDILIGSFAAGVIINLIIEGPDREPVSQKLEAIGYGFLVPIFFVVSGVTFDVSFLSGQPRNLALVPIFLILLLIIRGIPALALFRRDLVPRDRVALALFSATTLPLVVVCTRVGVGEGRLSAANGAALVAAGMVSVLVFPVVAMRVRSVVAQRGRGDQGEAM